MNTPIIQNDVPLGQDTMPKIAKVQPRHMVWIEFPLKGFNRSPRFKLLYEGGSAPVARLIASIFDAEIV